MTVEVNPSARIQVRHLGSLMHPGCCALCGYGGPERDYVDPAIFFDYEGQVYFCTLCMVEMAETLGMGTSEEFSHLKSLYESMNKKFQAQEAELNELRNFRDVVAAGIITSGLSVSGDNGVLASEVPAESDEQPSVSDESNDESLSERAGQDSEPTESGKGSGSNDSARTTSGNRPRQPKRDFTV